MSGLHDWFQTPPGQVALDWERACLDAALVDVFGYHALQLGLADLDALAANRMPHRWLARVSLPRPDSTMPTPTLVTESTALPFPEESLDLVVLPHTLEFSQNAHATLREVQRVLVHEGRVVIIGFNPASFWGWRQRRGRWLRRVGKARLYLPDAGELIAPWRLRDWLRLLEFEIESTDFGCYRPAVRGARTLARFGWMERLGSRWWPIFGATYCVMAVKRARGMHLVGQTWKPVPAAVRAPASIASRASPGHLHRNNKT